MKARTIADLTLVWITICVVSFVYGWGGLAVWGIVLGSLVGGLVYLILAGKEMDQKNKRL